MRFKRFRSSQIVFTLICGGLLASFVAAQTLPLMRGVVAPQGPPPAATPTPPAAAGAAVKRQHSKRRDLSLYAKTGPLNFDGDNEPVRAQARGFLLAHWRGRRLGHLSVVSAGPDGRQTVRDFFVEPDPGGQWCVVMETPGGAETFRVVEEVEMPESGPPVLGDSDAGGRRPSARKGLHLKQSQGANSGLIF